MKMKLTTRPDFLHLPELPLPFYLRSIGDYCFPPGFSGGGNQKTGFVQLFWGIAGCGRITIDRDEFELGPGDVVLKYPTESHCYQNGETAWELRWLTIDGPLAEAFIRGYDYPRHIVGAGPCPLYLFDQIAVGLQEMSPYSQRRLLAITTELLARIGSCHHEDTVAGRLVGQCLELLRNQYRDPNLNVNYLAECLNVHRSTLTRLFADKMMTTPGAYLLRLRLQQALTLLRESDRPIGEIAAATGMPDSSRFCRTFKKMLGLSPAAYRKQTGTAGSTSILPE